MKLLFITQKINSKDDDLAFVILWIKEFIKQGAEVKVICLEKGDFDKSFEVHSLGKERGFGKLRRVFRFLKLIFTLDYDRVFVHMNPEYFTLGGWYWFLRRIPMYLWYTHYTIHAHLRVASFLCKRMFAATKQSLPQYEGNSKKVVTGHGIDVGFWMSENGISDNQNSKKELLAVHRICRSKRLELAIKSLKYLPKDYSLTIYGREVEKDYAKELRDFVRKEFLEKRIRFMGPVAMGELKDVYPKFSLLINMASETIDKTMLESMLFGVYPITTKANSKAIGLPVSIENDNPKEIADFILSEKYTKYDAKYLQKIVKDYHSLPALIKKMNNYIVEGK
jgi:glycosyltransferase involved in cell wall biosynthesis